MAENILPPINKNDFLISVLVYQRVRMLFLCRRWQHEYNVRPALDRCVVKMVFYKRPEKICCYDLIRHGCRIVEYLIETLEPRHHAAIYFIHFSCHI